MISSALLTAALALQVGPSPQVVPAGEVLEVNINPLGGALLVEAEDRSDIEVTGRHSDSIRLEINPGRTVEIHEVRPVRAALERTEYRIRVPRAMSVRVVSLDARVEVRGVRGDVSVTIDHGRAEVHGVSGTVTLDASTGDLVVEDSSGEAYLDTGVGEITVHGFHGPIEAESVRGPVALADVDAPSVRVTTNTGSVVYQGGLREAAVLDLASQRGNVDLLLPGSASATFEVGTVSGSFESDFDLGGVRPTLGQTFSFTVGGGAAQVGIITYSGAIRIREVGR